MIVDANLLILAVDEDSPFHESASSWLTEMLNGASRLGLPWESLVPFLRLSTHPRAAANPLRPHDAWQIVQSWLGAPAAWVPSPTPDHATILVELISTHQLTGNLMNDAVLAALAIEHGLQLASADTDFARFKEVRWVNPLIGD